MHKNLWRTPYRLKVIVHPFPFFFSNSGVAPHLARSYHHLFPPPDTILFIPERIDKKGDDEKGEEKAISMEKIEEEEKRLFDEITACCGCGERPKNIDEGKFFVYCSLCHSSLCQGRVFNILHFFLFLFFIFCRRLSTRILCTLATTLLRERHFC